MKRGVYIGHDPNLKGETAILRPKDGGYQAQFDNHKLGLHYTHNWVKFSSHDFKLDKEIFNG